MAVHSINLQEPSKEPASALMQAGQVAIEFLEQTDRAKKNQSFMIFWHMAKSAANHEKHYPQIEFEAAALKEMVAPSVSKDPSGWISPLWRDLENNQKLWSQGMTETAKAMGLGFVPILKKVSGSPAKYQLLAEAVDHSDAESTAVAVPQGGLRYTSATVAAPGAMISATLRHGVVQHVRPLLIFAVVCLSISLGVMFLLSWWMFSVALQMNVPVTTAHLSYLFVWAGISMIIYRAFRFLGDLGDFGIVMAPDFMVPFKEDHVTLEVRRNTQDKTVDFAFVRYTAICPVCGGTVLLHDGQKEFVGRIVGRCRVSPREHVFSFDQKFHTGHQLRDV